MTMCRLCGGVGVVYGRNTTANRVCPACGGTGTARAAVSAPAEKTLLDEFAVAAMQGLVSGHYDGGVRGIVAQAYDVAAAMMKERNRRDEMGNVKEAAE
jgi:hypothetical protein